MRFSLYRSGLIRPAWRWRLCADNGRIIATSGEGYRNKADCRDAIDLVKKSEKADVVQRVRYRLT